jgi:hypothetical protein
VAALLLVLAVAAAWAHARRRDRRARTDWERPVDVVVYVLGQGEPGAVARLGGTLERLAARLAEDKAALAPGPEPFRFEVVGPVEPARLPPAAAPGPSPWDRALHAIELWRAERAIREAAPEPAQEAFDVRVYIIPAPGGRRAFAEGIGAAGGEVGVVRATLDGDALLAATAAVHEALHALGATDKYDAAGHAIAPGGLYEADREPLYPQARAEIMVGELPLEPGRGRLPLSPDEIGIGPETAREIGW